MSYINRSPFSFESFALRRQLQSHGRPEPPVSRNKRRLVDAHATFFPSHLFFLRLCKQIAQPVKPPLHSERRSLIHRSAAESPAGSMRHVRTLPVFVVRTSPLFSNSCKCCTTAATVMPRGVANDRRSTSTSFFHSVGESDSPDAVEDDGRSWLLSRRRLSASPWPRWCSTCSCWRRAGWCGRQRREECGRAALSLRGFPRRSDGSANGVRCGAAV